jgi:hypothetical protein
MLNGDRNDTMLALFLAFLAHIATAIPRQYAQQPDMSDGQLHTLSTLYGSLYRISRHVEALRSGLIAWQKGAYHGSYWSGCQHDVQLIYHVVMLLDADINALVDFEQREKQPALRDTLRGTLQSKSDVFAIWTRLMRRNAEERFCGWETLARGERWQKRLLFPDYSMLLPTIATAQLADLAQSVYRDHQFDRFQDVAMLNWTALDYLPEHPPSTKVSDAKLLIPNYADTMVVPDEEARLAAIMNRIRERSQAFQAALIPVRALIVQQAHGDLQKLVPAINAS